MPERIVEMINLRQMTAADIFIVADIERRLFSDPWSAEAFMGALRNSNQIFFVADDDGTIAGYCGLMCVAGEGQILNVAVDVPYRRQGLATEMMRSMLEFGIDHGVSLFTLEVRASNEPAIRLYNSCAFVATGRRKDYYSKPREDAILMDLDLTDPATLIRLGSDTQN